VEREPPYIADEELLEAVRNFFIEGSGPARVCPAAYFSCVRAYLRQAGAEPHLTDEDWTLVLESLGGKISPFRAAQAIRRARANPPGD
jgi:hypothetical protein